MLARLKNERLDSKVIVLTMHHDADLATDAIRAGASGFLLKESAGDELLVAVRHALDGKVYITPAITKDVMDRMAGAAKAKEPQLTPRQRDILRLIVKGQRMKEIASNLGLSTRTVEGHKYEMMETLGVTLYSRAREVRARPPAQRGLNPLDRLTYFFFPSSRTFALPLCGIATRMLPIGDTWYRPRVLLAEDHAETAERLRKLLRADFDVIASVEDGDALVEAADRLSPDVIVTDIAMAGIDGIAAAVLIRRHDPNARIVFVTVHAESMFVEAGLEAGALGYVLKDSAGDDLVAAIQAALCGRQYVSRELRGFEGL